MKPLNRIGCAMLVGTVLLLGSTLPAWAMGPGGSHGGGFHHGRFHDDRVFVHSRIFIGAPFVIGGPFWWAPSPYYDAPPVIVQSDPSTYIQQGPAPSGYWYYCQNPAGYYPAVQACPGGWMTVVPQAP